MIKTNKLLRLKTKNGRLLDVVREHYLRKDIACHSEACADCEHGELECSVYKLLFLFWWARCKMSIFVDCSL